MGAAFFYHLTQAPLEDTLPRLLEKARGAGWKIAVRTRSQERMQWLDEKLWLQGNDSFLAHGCVGGAYDALQPILLTLQEGPANGAECIMAIDGAEVSAEQVETAERVCILFDGYDQDAVQNARVQWKALTDAGCAAQYWSEESGAWQKKAESGGT